MLKRLMVFIKSIPIRVGHSPNTTLGGGAVGVFLVALIGHLEDVSGCHFTTAFANIDWGQVLGYGVAQTFGALMTDADKTIAPPVPAKTDIVVP